MKTNKDNVINNSHVFWPKCKYSAKHICDLNRHISRHLHKRQFVCNQCNKDFNHLTSLNDHKRYIHSNVRQFVCRITNCQKKFKTNKDLNHHKRIHSSEKPFKCTECDKRFKRSQHLKDHKLIHSEIKPFKCYVNDCGKRFGMKSLRYGDHFKNPKNFEPQNYSKKPQSLNPQITLKTPKF